MHSTVYAHGCLDVYTHHMMWSSISHINCIPFYFQHITLSQHGSSLLTGELQFKWHFLSMCQVMTMDPHGADGDRGKHWSRKQQGPRTLCPISAAPCIKLPFSDKIHWVLLLARLEVKQEVAEKPIAPFSLLTIQRVWHLPSFYYSIDRYLAV